jgi:ATP-dependent Clp protease ATP-binding subunit ClpA
VNAGPALAPDAAMVLGIASTAMPFARTPAAAAERWLRVLRLTGEVGTALQALGVSEGPLGALGESIDREQTGPASVDEHDAVAQVTEHAVRIASQRGATEVTTTDVLMAVMRLYGADFDRVLRAHGTDRDQVIERLGVGLDPKDG